MAPLFRIKSFRHRLLLLVGATVMILTGFSLYLLYSYNKLLHETNEIEQRYVLVISLANQVQLHLQQQNLAWANLLLRGQDPQKYHDYLSAFYEQDRLTTGTALALLAELGDDEVLHGITEQFLEKIRKNHLSYRNALQVYNASVDPAIAADRFLAAKIEDPVAEILHIVTLIKSRQSTQLSGLKQYLAREQAALGTLSALVLISAALLLFWFVDRHFGKPLSEAINTANEISQGNLAKRLELAQDSEFQVFSQAFNTMVARLATVNDSLAEKVSALEEEVALRKRAEQNQAAYQKDLEYILEELESYSYSIAHDLRAPLRRIAGFSAILLEDANERLQPEDTVYLNRITHSAKHMAELIDDILTLSRVSRRELETSVVDLSDYVANSIHRLQESQPQREISLILQPGIKVIGDPSLLRLVIDNLVDNAWKYTSKKSHADFEFGSDYRDGRAVCFIKDNGVGFDSAYAHKLFGVFQRLHLDHEFEGTGVGLATVARIIRRHGGKVWAEGEPDRGATFYFELQAA